MMPRSHGGPDEEGVPLHDFSSNSNACGPCPVALAAVQQADAACYPDATYAVLRAQLADFHGVNLQRMVLAGSASEFIFRITALAGQRGARAVWLPPHAYGDYAHAAQAWRLAVVPDPAQAPLRWACEPSSPLGVAQAGLDQLAGGGALCVLDRAYEPLRLSGASALADTALQKFWQLWTPNKALGLTGVRAAYVIAPPDAEELVAQLESLAASWPVGAHGVAMLQAWTTPEVQSWLTGSLDTLRDWKTRQVALCESGGWRCLPSEANFFCARPALPESVGLQQALAQLRAQGIKLRDATSFGLPGHVRMSVMPPAAQDALRLSWRGLRRNSGMSS
ncbi:MAG: aminotransferase class I/II-fold pyridoxal phosphate-dependent enzyme [Polaromonas sp.]|uniref:aminotransferase class I/II-fold pyridoxal phosphate-dependent enzyme n=1 Tax=Polaromonas sp. TaxID=1869339 RepID=UPI0027325465|nr:aminotransferase class I/II-fold pyridoxal phosphate-dependent enzyme [Polaromonas sp.]MDP2818042.1 aminotransferase class I/II-fold pyridoxal phosphate-dependent enzyme [Polaromonas sp.]